MTMQLKSKQEVALEREGVLLLNKPAGITSFALVGKLRKLLNVRKIGHAGTLDPFATGLMVMLIGRNYTKQSDSLLTQDKEYLAEATLGLTTDSFDCDGEETGRFDFIPTEEEVKKVIEEFQGPQEQLPPMFSAKKVNGKKLCDLARKGETVERKKVMINVEIDLLDYSYPHLTFRVRCSKGTYIRSLAHDIGQKLGSGAHLTKLHRTGSGQFRIEGAVDVEGLTLDQALTSLKRGPFS